MANIDNELSQIRTAIYGTDMRKAIGDAINKINIDYASKAQMDSLKKAFDHYLTLKTLSEELELASVLESGYYTIDSGSRQYITDRPEGWISGSAVLYNYNITKNNAQAGRWQVFQTINNVWIRYVNAYNTSVGEWLEIMTANNMTQIQTQVDQNTRFRELLSVDPDPISLTWETGSISVSSGGLIENDNYIRTQPFKLDFENAGEISVSSENNSYYFYLFTYYIDGTFDYVQGVSIYKNISSSLYANVSEIRICARLRDLDSGKIELEDANNFSIIFPYDLMRALLKFVVQDKYDYSDGNIYFQVQVNSHLPNDGVVISQDDYESEELVSIPCVLMLPENYTKDGAPVPLVMYSHGTSGYVTDNETNPNYAAFSKMLNDNGYAMFGCNGIPYDSNAGRPGMNMGCPMAVSAFHKAFEYIKLHYNVEPKVYIFASSQGGLAGLNFANKYPSDVRAIGLQYPVTDLYEQAWQHPWNEYVHDAIKQLYGFSSNDWEADKVIGYNPKENRHVEINGENYIFCPVPIMVWHGDADTTVAYQGSVNYVNAVRKAGIEAHLRTIDSATHGDNKVFYAMRIEMPLWFNRFR